MIKEAHVGVGINSMSTDKREDSVPMTLSNQEDEEIIITESQDMEDIHTDASHLIERKNSMERKAGHMNQLKDHYQLTESQAGIASDFEVNCYYMLNELLFV